LFVRDALDHTRKLLDREQKETRVAKRTPPEEQHVTGQQLLAGVRELALQSYGPMVVSVFDAWGIRSCEDFGEIVFIMVEHKLLKKTENDSRAHFENGYDFYEAFRKPFLPLSKITALAEPPKEANA
jgi:uncharacterized repeat protein (TIGR04138 family)